MIRFLLLVSALGNFVRLPWVRFTAPKSSPDLRAVTDLDKPERNSIQYYLDEIANQGDLFA